jgi:hypothetical protein
MIISNIIGGLGNQIFQYAAGLSLALEKKTKFNIAIDMFKGYSLHQGFELERVFGIEAKTVTRENLKDLISWRATPNARRLLNKIPYNRLVHGNNFVSEYHNINPNLFYSLPINSYLHGYWQSNRFFNRHLNEVIESLKFKIELDIKNLDTIAKIEGGTSASVHIRRGDYLSAKNIKTYGMCSFEYYISSMSYLEERHGPICFYIFSDDTIWAKDFFSKLNFSFKVIDHNKGDYSYKDMQLMSLCDHNIIANSTFSWWGAFINKNPEKIVISPKFWKLGLEASKVNPDSWLLF